MQNESKRKRENSSATIYDIAKLAGVNPSTVSRALNNPGRINSVTEARIRAAAKELNYRVNPFARALPTGRTKMLAMVVADITNPMFFEAVRGAETLAMDSGYTLVIVESQESGSLEATAVERLLPTVDGLILVTTRLEDEEVERISNLKPVVLMNRQIPGIPDVVPQVNSGISEAIAHLKSLGHNSIAYVSGPSNSWMSRHRWDLIMKQAVAEGMKVVEIGPNEPTLEGGKASADYVVASGVTGVIAYNDLMAIGLMSQLAAKGKEIPKDLSIIGFDDIFGSDLTTPALTTIKSPLYRAGELAMQLVLSELEDSQNSKQEVASLTTQLVKRASTAKAR